MHFYCLYWQIGVGIMFVVLFMVIVAIELVCKAMHEKLECGHYKKTDVEDVDPAALVGTFKRYKWNKIASGKFIAVIFSGGQSTSKCDFISSKIEAMFMR